MIVRVPVLVPAVAGVKVTLMVQLAPMARGTGQLLLSEKSPLGTILVMFNGASPVLDRVRGCGALVEATFWSPNVRVMEDRVTVAEVAILVMKASEVPAKAGWRGPTVGKSVEKVVPVR